MSILLTGCTASTVPNTSNVKDAQNSNSFPIKVSDGTEKQEYFIRLTSPQKDQVLKSPFLVGGEAILPDDTAYIRIKKMNGDIVITEQTRIKKDENQAGAFGVLISFVFQATDKGVVEVYGIDPDTGKEAALKSVEVNFDKL